jgi:hypothetical protein
VVCGVVDGTEVEDACGSEGCGDGGEDEGAHWWFKCEDVYGFDWGRVDLYDRFDESIIMTSRL